MTWSGAAGAPRRRGVVLGVMRILWGAVLLAVPGRVLRLVGAPAGGRAAAPVSATAVVRVLGCRHVAQGAVAVAAWPRWRRAGTAADVAHAASMVAFGAADRWWRVPAFADSLVAGAFAAAGAWAGGARPSPGPGDSTGRRPAVDPGHHRR